MKYLGKITDPKDLMTREYGEGYGVCSTTNSTQAKTVSIAGVTELHSGLSIRVKFSNAQTYNGIPTLNVNSLGAINIYKVDGTAAGQYAWGAGEILDLVYDGIYWIIVNGAKQNAVSSTSVSASGLCSFKDGNNSTLFTLQLPLYNGGVS